MSMNRLCFTVLAAATLLAGCSMEGMEGTKPGGVGKNGISVTLNMHELGVPTGGTETLTVAFNPESAAGKELSWESSDERVAIVTDGKVTGLAPGNALVTVRCGDAYDQCRVTVYIPVTSLQMSLKNVVLLRNEELSVKEDLTVEPAAATEPMVWETSDEKVASVQHGKVTGIGTGVATITVSTTACSTSFEVYVLPITEFLYLGESSLALLEDERHTLQLTSTFKDLPLGMVECVSSDESIVSVNNKENGEISLLGVGKGVATVTCSVRTYSVECVVHVQRVPDPKKAVDFGIIGHRQDSQGRVITSHVYWSTCNMGATKPEEYGDYYAWGDVNRYHWGGFGHKEYPNWNTGYEEGFCWKNYIWTYYVGGTLYFTKYYRADSDRRWGGEGKADGKVYLDPEDDIATKTMKVLDIDARIPSLSEWKDLRVSTDYSITTKDGVIGMEFSGNGTSIFIPCGGSRSGTSLDDGDFGMYWTSERVDKPETFNLTSDKAYAFYFSEDYVYERTRDRCEGLPIRYIIE